MYSANFSIVNFKPEWRATSMASRTEGGSDGVESAGGVAGWGWAGGGAAWDEGAWGGAAEGSKPG